VIIIIIIMGPSSYPTNETSNFNLTSSILSNLYLDDTNSFSFSNFSANSSVQSIISTMKKKPPRLEALSSSYQTFLVTLYSFTAFCAIIANITGVLVLLGSKKSSLKLKFYLVNLAFSDILISIFSTPFTYTDFMYGQWIFSPILCPIANFIQICTVCVSVYTLIAIGIER
jgi:hypothetical protein